ncbi:11015_t:CDS:2 [Ambispora leptoticha]|uniref:11015_t:CDS:1 n=1 Tax=Ambispora leptoticha TaxID=144679 RepID=A0A9N8Z7U3_9GLOM|nr:11015_t:CDS:2 [Ambispora leptoticha]
MASETTQLIRNYEQPKIYDSFPSSTFTKPIYRLYPERWYGLAMIALLNMSIIFCCFSFAPIANTSASYFDVSLTAINMLPMEYMLVYLVMPPFSNAILDKYGVKFGLLIAATLNAFGAIIRYFSICQTARQTKFLLVLIGQSISAIANPFVQITPTKYVMMWFGEKERTTATMIASIANPVAGALSYFIIPQIGDDTTRVPYVLLATAVFASILVLPTLLMKERPRTPPTYSAVTPSEKMLPGIKKLVNNKNFWILLGSFATINGFRSALLGLLSVIFVSYGYSEIEAGKIGTIMIISGIAGAISLSLLVDKYHVHRFVLKICAPIIGLLFFSLVFIVREDNLYFIESVCAIIGFLQLSLIPIFLELAVECSYPISANTSAALLYTGSGFMGVIATIVMDYLRASNENENAKMTKSLWFEGIIVLIAGFSVLFYNSRDLRWDAEQRGNSHIRNSLPND